MSVKAMISETDILIDRLSRPECILYAKECTRRLIAFGHAIDECVLSNEIRRKILLMANDLVIAKPNETSCK